LSVCARGVFLRALAEFHSLQAPWVPALKSVDDWSRFEDMGPLEVEPFPKYTPMRSEKPGWSDTF
jgi:hypothetical protein